MDLSEDIQLFTIELARSGLGDVVVCQVKLRVVEINTKGFLKFILHLSLLFLYLFSDSIFDDVDRHFIHSVNVDINSVPACDRIRNFLVALSMDLNHVSLK